MWNAVLQASGAASAKSDENYGAPPAYYGAPAANSFFLKLLLFQSFKKNLGEHQLSKNCLNHFAAVLLYHKIFLHL